MYDQRRHEATLGCLEGWLEDRALVVAGACIEKKEKRAMNVAERRTKRSEIMREAIRYQLEYCREKFDVRALVLADERGLMVAAADEGQELSHILAAYAPLLCRVGSDPGRHRELESVRVYLPAVLREELSVRPFEVWGERLYVCALGSVSAHKNIATCRAMGGVRRIVEGGEMDGVYQDAA